MITGRHSVLRSTFSNADGFAVHGLLPHQAVDLPVIDLTHLGKNERRQAAWRLVIDESQCSFNLASGPLFRGKILKLDSRDHVLLLSTHRIAADEWSMELLLSELATIYQATLDQTTGPFPELAVQFNDFRIWQNQCVLFADQLSHWKQVLSGKLPVLDLPTDRPRPPVQRLNGTAEYDLSLSVEEGEKQLLGSFTYDRDLFEDSTIKRLIGHWETLLSAAVQDPEQPISRLPLLTPAERRQILVEWNRTSSDYPTDQCLHQLFETQVQRSSHRVAVVFEGHRLNYRELNARANQLAHYLRRHGVGPEVKVAISLDRSLEMVIAVLAVLKAGGAYVPLDPTYPQERLAFMIADSQARILLTRQSSLFDLLSSENHLVCLDTEHEAITAECTENPTGWTSPDNLAYILYTSGSTGKPKGVMITHRNQMNIYHAWEEAYQLRTAVSSHLQMASYSFDVFSGDLARALCSGGKLVLCPQKALLDGSLLYRLMRDEKVDFGEFVPTVLRNLVQYLEKTGQSLSFMRVVVAGSDSWYGSDLDQLKKFCGRDTRIINSYGITEATIDSLYYEVPRNAQLPREGLVPVGRPFANTRVYILDPCF